ncbi:peptide-methionine (S)-S-oxide reductase MsrA [Nitratiruptor sp. SB155-2]|uniref:Peptide methionine sulfoxide reductase MsrA n=1 Tax=Nitratiruptor sp. (strain SB155-2) TaxID=387092 RepID=MSRA_NITSB|nr:peptide-methionine (S)-S-oxide reductase MsrA [Nitratiruptor sp. SB155-2]A6Q418.1 RecName: Full=Peptide methionine sulfoxide reductase MsrA; Short=Protein-methionine-S-oxide reductase; AltName: Full=Peptide-methionine (S)-S-oxide reductase; Short=Peptide Met(O) reductase [Nitratiruptor sp. SB155-2]BAF70227.1 peptide-methionine (S)-S-oxide reductase [Nitratiruptor sp. SB155-2]
MSESAIVGGGCFWCLEAIFQRVKGVHRVTSGYAGCRRQNPTYEQVCTGTTKCAEVVKIDFDPHIINYEELLHIFFAVHDPTQLNRQGADIGTQYRSVIFPLNEEQKAIAQKVIQKLNPYFENKIVTTIENPGTFYEAESYHQNYYNTHPDQGYCQVVIAPKLKKFMNMFQEYLQ